MYQSLAMLSMMSRVTPIHRTPHLPAAVAPGFQCFALILSFPLLGDNNIIGEHSKGNRYEIDSMLP